ncbi:MAG: 50S ribosomal protein L3 [Opitutales bacterium]
MSFALIGKKVGMTQVFDDANQLVPVTVVEAGPCPVTQIKTSEKDGYSAVQIGYRPQKAGRLSAAERGHLKKAGVDPVSELQEFRTEDTAGYNLGEPLTVEKLEGVAKVDIIGVSKGRGFQGVVKRYRFAGGNKTHGSMTHRRGGSYGMCQWPGEILKGKKMPGHMGAKRRTVQNLKVVKIIPEKNLILIKGSLPGFKNGLITIRPAKKAKKEA